MLCALVLSPLQCHAQGHRAVNLSGASKNLPFSDGIVGGNTLCVAGQQGTDASGKLKEGINDQIEAMLERIRQIVTKAGFEMKDVVTVNVYLSDIADFAAMNKVYVLSKPQACPHDDSGHRAGQWSQDRDLSHCSKREGIHRTSSNPALL